MQCRVWFRRNQRRNVWYSQVARCDKGICNDEFDSQSVADLGSVTLHTDCFTTLGPRHSDLSRLMLESVARGVESVDERVLFPPLLSSPDGHANPNG